MPVKSEAQHPKPLTVNVDGDQVPKALLTAFNKDKKPFTYFTSGEKPDLATHPSPSAIRKASPLLNAPTVPRVLPFVSQHDLDIEERRSATEVEPKENHHQPKQLSIRTDHEPEKDMASLTHAQYNSPMPLYSKENVQDVVRQTEGFLHGRPHSAASGQFNPSQSGAYRLLQENGQIAPAHSARLEEQKDDYPHYRGFVDPRVQSPSFKRLQYVTGMDSATEDEISHELHPPVKSRSDDVRSGAGSRQSAGSQHEYSAQHQQQQQYQEYKPQWMDNASGPRVAQRDPTVDREETFVDPNFATRIAEAERPKVPPSVVPSWARKAQEKQQKWQQYGDNYQQRHYEYTPPAANWQPDAHKVQDKWSTHYGGSRFDTYEQGHRARSSEPYGRRVGTHEGSYGTKKEWMKPYIAPNLRDTKFSPPRLTSYSPLSSSRYRKPQEYGTYYNPASDAARPYSSLSTTSSTYRQRTRSPYEYSNPGPDQRYQSGRSTYDYSTTSDYGSATPTPRKEVNVSTLVSGEALQPTPTQTVPPWSKHAEYKRTVWESKRGAVDPEHRPRQTPGEVPPPWAHKAEQTHSLWQSEADAWRQRQQMESDSGRRATSAGPRETTPYGSERRYESRYNRTTTNTTSESSPSWRQRPVPHEVTAYAPPAPEPSRWQPVPGGETKTQSSGNYLDRDGNQVSFTKETYTSSDPGKEYSMLTEEEKRILEQPMDPGVVSRHITKKYYKKTTNTSTTTTTQQPVQTTVTNYYPPSQDANSHRFTRGVSEF